MNTRQAKLDKHALRASALIAGGLFVGALVGLLTGVAGQSLLLFGLWPLAAGVALGFGLTALSHRLSIQSRHVHLSVATLSVLMWCATDRAADGALVWLNQRAAIAQSGLLLADHAVVHGSDDPSALTDAALLADTGASGIQGALRVALRSGVPVLRAGHVQRVVRAPRWVVIGWIAGRCGAVIWLVLLALEALRREPICRQCGRWNHRKSLGWLHEKDALNALKDGPDALLMLARHSKSSAEASVELLEDHCPLGHSKSPGYELRRGASRTLVGRRPGSVAIWSAQI